jgi:hypothetical protein
MIMSQNLLKQLLHNYCNDSTRTTLSKSVMHSMWPVTCLTYVCGTLTYASPCNKGQFLSGLVLVLPNTQHKQARNIHTFIIKNLIALTLLFYFRKVVTAWAMQSCLINIIWYMPQPQHQIILALKNK